MDHVRAVAVLLVCGFMLFQGFPGLDSMGAKELATEEKQQALRDQVGPFWADVGIGIATLNREYRLPLHKKLHVFERPIRGAQNWGLYTDGPGKVRRMEIWVDGELKHRSADPDATWLSPQLRMRRVRPMVETTTIKVDAQNWEGLSRFIVQSAVRDFDAQWVEIRATVQKQPGTGEVTVNHRIVAGAPDFELKQL